MNLIDPRAAMKLQPELSSGETIYWAGMPNPSVIFHSADWAAVPFSLLWGGFAIFWETSVLGYWGFASKSPSHPVSYFMALWGVPFVVIGQYMIWGRFFVDSWLKRRTYYAVTNRRILILQEGWKRSTRFSFLESIPELTCEGSVTGTLWLGTKLPILGSRRSSTQSFSQFATSGPVARLVDIDGVDSVYRLILDLREQAGKQTSASN